MEAVIKSPLGNLKLIEEDEALTEIRFSKNTPINLPKSEILMNVKQQLDGYFAGNQKKFDVLLKPKGTEFQQIVWQELLTIPYGKTISYMDLAKRLGDPKCIRAAASANGKNPIPIIIPCHRVIGSNGEMTGYAGGIQLKKALLTLEKAAVMDQLTIF